MPHEKSTHLSPDNFRFWCRIHFEFPVFERFPASNLLLQKGFQTREPSFFVKRVSQTIFQYPLWGDCYRHLGQEKQRWTAVRTLFEQSEFVKDRRNQTSLLLSLVPVKSLNGILQAGVPRSWQQQGCSDRWNRFCNKRWLARESKNTRKSWTSILCARSSKSSAGKMLLIFSSGCPFMKALFCKAVQIIKLASHAPGVGVKLQKWKKAPLLRRSASLLFVFCKTQLTDR